MGWIWKNTATISWNIRNCLYLSFYLVLHPWILYPTTGSFPLQRKNYKLLWFIISRQDARFEFNIYDIIPDVTEVSMLHSCIHHLQTHDKKISFRSKEYKDILCQYWNLNVIKNTWWVLLHLFWWDSYNFIISMLTCNK